MDHHLWILQIVKNADRNCFLVSRPSHGIDFIIPFLFNKLSRWDSIPILA